MYLKQYLEKLNDKKIKLFIDMDGVIADYEFGIPKNFDKKRPLYDSLKKLKEISEMDNIEIYILSITRQTIGIQEKNNWLDKFAPFFKKENRIIISREENNYIESSKLKAQYINNINKEETIIVIDDDPRVLKEIDNLNKNIILLKDTVLVD